MSFTGSKTAHGFAAGYFLAGGDESCVRLTKTISASHAQAKTTAEGTKYVPAGAVIPSNATGAVGILYEDIDVTNGDAPGSVVVEGRVYESRLPAEVVAAAKTSMAGITFVATEPAVTRPY